MAKEKFEVKPNKHLPKKSRLPKKKIYHLILLNHGKQLKKIKDFVTEKDGMKMLNKMVKDSNKILFPIRWNNLEHFMVESEYELALIKVKQEEDSPVTKIRNEYGKFVNFDTSSDDWILVDKQPYNIEETFWVYGYHPKLQRKTFEWIFTNFIADGGKDKLKFKSIQVFRNKVLIECNTELNMVLCKNHSDAVRMYNLIEKCATKAKFRFIAYMGKITGRKVSSWVKKIKELTNWNDRKILRLSTRD